MVFWIFLDRAAFQDGQAVIEGPTGHHLARVLRVRIGEQGVGVSEGREHRLQVTAIQAATVMARVIGQEPVRGEPAVAITLLQALLPNPDFDAVIEAGTAVGVSRFLPVRAARSVAQPAAARLARWQSIAQSAAEQSHRGRIPSINPPKTLEAALADVDGRFLLLDPSAAQSLPGAMDGSSRYTLAVGPEGGWTDGELAMMRKRDAVGVNLGPRILRARLAPVIAAAILVQQS